MKRLICILLTMLLALPLCVTAFAAEFEIDQHVTLNGMEFSWYQGYEPVIRNNSMTLYLPIRAATCVGDITVSIQLDDPNVFLLAAQPNAVTVSPKNGTYPVKLVLSLQRQRRNGDYPATITVKGIDPSGKEIAETIPYVIRIRGGYDSHETMEPLISNVVGNLNVGTDGRLCLTIANPTTTQSITDGMITVTDSSGEILMSGTNRIGVGEILPGRSAEVTVPLTVSGHASVRQHSITVQFRYRVLEIETMKEETFVLPVTQSIRLEQGGVQMPEAIEGELANMSLTLMNMGKGELLNVLVKLEVEGVLDAQSVLVGSMIPGETKQVRLTFTPKYQSAGLHSGTVTVTCEDAYGNTFSQILDTILTINLPIPDAEIQQPVEDQKEWNVTTLIFAALCVLLSASIIIVSTVLTRKIHKLEEERL